MAERAPDKAPDLMGNLRASFVSLGVCLEWRVVPSIPEYEVSNLGQVRRAKPGKSTRVGRLLRPMPSSKYGHQSVFLRGRRHSVHKIVLTAFVRPPRPGEEARHLDGDPTNNQLSNLAWGSRHENVADRIRHGTQQRGVDYPQAKLTEDDVRVIRAEYGSPGATYHALARRFGVSHTTIRLVVIGKKWRHVT